MSVHADSVQPREDQGDEAHLHLPDGFLVRSFFLLLNVPVFLSPSSTVHQLRQRSFLSYRFATSFAYYGLVMDLQKFGVSLISISTEANLCCWQLAVEVPT